MKKEIISFFLNDFWRKIGAFAIALIVWTGIHTDLQRNRMVENLPVTIRFDDPSRWVILAPPPHVAIVLRGSERRLNDLNLAGITIKAKLPPANAKLPAGRARYTVDLAASDVNLPNEVHGIACTKIMPAQIEVEIDRVETLKNVPVRAQVPSDAAGIASQLAIIPDTVEITGPSSQLKTLTSVPTALIDPRLLNDGRKIEVSLEEKPLFRYNPPQVQIMLKPPVKPTATP